MPHGLPLLHSFGHLRVPFASPVGKMYEKLAVHVRRRQEYTRMGTFFLFWCVNPSPAWVGAGLSWLSIEEKTKLISRLTCTGPRIHESSLGLTPYRWR